MSRLARAFTAAMVADVQRVTGYAAKSGDLAAALAPYAAQCEQWEREGRKLKRLTKALKRLVDGEMALIATETRKPPSVRDIAERNAQALLPFPKIPSVNGHDLRRTVNRDGQIPPWHPEA